MYCRRKKKFFLVLGIFIINTIISSIIANTVYFISFANIEKELKKSANNVAITAAKSIELDIESYIELTLVEDYSQGNYDKEYYNRMQKLFQSIQEETGVSFIYTEKMISDSQVTYIFDGENSESEDFSPIGAVDGLEEIERRAFKEGLVIATDIIKDPYWGDYITGFAPISNTETGEVIGLVGVDFSIDYVQDSIRTLKESITMITVTAMFIATLLTYKLIDSRYAALYTDQMTGLYSKNFHERALKKAIKTAKDSNNPLSLIMIDIDYFKQINDKLGHNVGDKVIKYIAQNIIKSIRKTDICSRFGGDEFIVILPNTNKELAKSVAQRIMAGIKEFNPYIKEEFNMDFDLTLSMGIAEWNEDITDTELLQYADIAMYSSKRNGRNTFAIYQS